MKICKFYTNVLSGCNNSQNKSYYDVIFKEPLQNVKLKSLRMCLICKITSL